MRFLKNLCFGYTIDIQLLEGNLNESFIYRIVSFKNMAETAFRGAIEFFERLGIYDVVLPFLLVFTIVFAILERTKIFGTEKIEGKEYPKKNLNAMAAFVIALLVVASAQIVSIINRGLAKVVLLLIIVLSFLLLIGTFYGREEEVKLEKGWRTWGMVTVAIGIALIFANETGWLEPFWLYLTANFNSAVVGSVILIILIISFMSYVTRPEAKAEEKKESKA